MPGPNLITVLRGFKVRTSTLDEFLVANGKAHGIQTGTLPPLYTYDDNGNATDEISEVLRSRVQAAGGTDTTGVLFLVPPVEGHDHSAWAYISYSYSQVYAQRRITTEDPPERVPPGFEELRRKILGYSSSPDCKDEGLIGLYIVLSEKRASSLPAVLKERYNVSP